MKIIKKRTKFLGYLFMLWLSLQVIFPKSLPVNAAVDLVQYVNPFLGTAGAGFCYPGAQAPFGMIQWSPDTRQGPGGNNYDPGDTNIRDFSLLHLNGVGCSCAGDIPIIPVVSALGTSPVGNRTAYQSAKSGEVASAGYYKTYLNGPAINVELTTTTRAGIARLGYPSSTNSGIIIVPPNAANGIYNGSLSIDTTNRKISGWAQSGGFCGSSNKYTVYFCAKFDRAFRTYGTWSGGTKNSSSTSASGNNCAAYVQFDTTTSQTVYLKVGVSFVSTANAEQNLNTEIPDWGFDTVKNNTSNAWNDFLNKIVVSGGSTQQMRMFYTAMYHLAQCPSIASDVNGQYRGINDSVKTIAAGHKYYATYSLWDTYRTAPQLLAIMAPDVCSDQIRTMLLMSQECSGGGLPGWSYYNSDPSVMGTYPAPIFISNGYAFGARDYDLTAMKNKLVQCATQTSPLVSCNSPYNTGCQWWDLGNYISKGYKPNSCSETLEYAITDFAIAKYCEAMGDTANYNTFLQRSQGVFKIVNSDGWMQRKDANGNWVTPFSTTATDGFVEGCSAQYSWDIPHNVAGLIQKMGGNASFIGKLDNHLSQYVTGWPTSSPYWWIGNEPGFGAPFKYNWAQAPWRTQYHIRNALDSKFHDGNDGLPGNDDSGTTSAWVVFAMMGIYPEIPGVGGLTIFSPSFGNITLNLANGKQFNLIANNQSSTNRYIQSATLNGANFTKLWITMDQINQGGNLTFNLGASANTNWGNSASDAPPSFSDTSTPGPTPTPAPGGTDLCTGGTVSASGENAPNESKEKAFDDATSSKWLVFADLGWIQYDFAGENAYAVNQYTITSANDFPERDPKDWYFKGSNDGSTWTTLDTRSGEVFSSRFQKKSYSLSNGAAYKIYRLDITSNYNPPTANSTQLAEIEMFGSGGSTPTPTPTATPTSTLGPTATPTPTPAATATPTPSGVTVKANFENTIEGWTGLNIAAGAWSVTEWAYNGSYSLKADVNLSNNATYELHKTANDNFTGKSQLKAVVRHSTSGTTGGMTAKIYVKTGSGWTWYDGGAVAINSGTGGTVLTLNLSGVANLDQVKEYGVEYRAGSSGASGSTSIYIDYVTLQ